MNSVDPTSLQIECYGQRAVDYLSSLSQMVKGELLLGKDVTLVRSIELNGSGGANLKIRLYFSPRHQQRIKRIFFVEDVISAIKLGKFFDSKKDYEGYVAMPIFGSHISQLRLSRCLLLFHDNPTIAVWLDRDKASQAIKFAKQAESLGFKSSTIITEVDPKEIPFANLLSIFNN